MKAYGELPETAKINETDTFGPGDEDDNVEFDEVSADEEEDEGLPSKNDDFDIVSLCLPFLPLSWCCVMVSLTFSKSVPLLVGRHLIVALPMSLVCYNPPACIVSLSLHLAFDTLPTLLFPLPPTQPFFPDLLLMQLWLPSLFQLSDCEANRLPTPTGLETRARLRFMAILAPMSS